MSRRSGQFLQHHFNPRSREGSDRRMGGRLRQPRNFNPRSREGSDRLSHHFDRQPRFYFNPRSREGSDRDEEIEEATAFAISIHAPVKGATR